jgi:hypothetical protein
MNFKAKRASMTMKVKPLFRPRHGIKLVVMYSRLRGPQGRQDLYGRSPFKEDHQRHRRRRRRHPHLLLLLVIIRNNIIIICYMN